MRPMRLPLPLLLAAALLAGCPARQAAPLPLQRLSAYRPPPIPANELDALRAAGVDPARVGWALWDVESAALVSEQRGAVPFMPASVTKLVSTVCALHVLGAEHTFETTVLRAGEVRDGVLEGDLILHGEGDPHLTAPELMSLAQALRRAGVRAVRGRFLYDESFLTASPYIDVKQEPESTYNPPVSALSLEANTFALRWEPTAVPGEAQVFTVPSFPDVAVALAPQPFPDGSRVKLAPQPTPETWLLSPAAGAQGSVTLPIRSPALRVAQLFRRFAQGSGVELPEPTPGRASPGARPLVRHKSAPLPALVEQLLSTSDNLMTELVTQAAARKLRGDAVTLQEGAEAVLAWWKARRPEVDWSTAHLINASGLTAEARLTPRQVLAVLDEAAKQSYGGRELGSLLAVGGARGTLSKRMDAPDVSLAAWAKTGTMNFAVGLAGELLPANGRRKRFVIFVNDLEARARNDARQLTDAQGAEAESDAWATAARKGMDALVRLWLR